MPARQVQWGVRLVWSDGLVMDEPSGMGEEYARAFVRQINEREPRPDDPTPRATSAVLTRRTVTYGDWEEVATEPGEEDSSPPPRRDDDYGQGAADAE